MGIRELANKVTVKMHGLSGSTVFLTGPDGIRRQYDDCIFTSGRITESPDSGEEIVVINPVASFSRSSLVVVPQNGEKWALEAPVEVGNPDELTMFQMDKSKSIEGGKSLDTIILKLTQSKQS